LALANGDRIKDKQRSRNSFIVDMDKKHAAENLLSELSAHHGAMIRQVDNWYSFSFFIFDIVSVCLMIILFL